VLPRKHPGGFVTTQPTKTGTKTVKRDTAQALGVPPKKTLGGKENVFFPPQKTTWVLPRGRDAIPTFGGGGGRGREEKIMKKKNKRREEKRKRNYLHHHAVSKKTEVNRWGG